MEYSKEQIVNGIMRYAKNDMLPQIPDKNFKIIAASAVGLAETKPEILNKLFENPVMSAFKTDKGYDIEAVISALRANVDSLGGFTVTIPAVKFLMPEEKQLTFKSDDIDKVMSYIKGAI